MVAAGLLFAAGIGLQVASGSVEPTGTAAPAPQGDVVPDLSKRPVPISTSPPPGAASPAPRAGSAVAAAAAGDAVATATPGVTLGVAVRDRATGETAVGAAGALPMYSASLVKIVVAVDVLQRRRTGLPVSPQAIELIHRSLGPSDDQAMNALWVRFDGPGAVGRVAAQLGLAETRTPQDPSQWGEALLSARDAVTLYDHVLTGMPAGDRELIIGALGSAPAVATDGFDQAFGLRAAAPVPSKQGWMCCQGGRITLHSVGAADPDRRFVVALLSSQPRSAGYDGARSAVTTVAAAVQGPLT